MKNSSEHTSVARSRAKLSEPKHYRGSLLEETTQPERTQNNALCRNEEKVHKIAPEIIEGEQHCTAGVATGLRCCEISVDRRDALRTSATPTLENDGNKKQRKKP